MHWARGAALVLLVVMLVVTPTASILVDNRPFEPLRNYTAADSQWKILTERGTLEYLGGLDYIYSTVLGEKNTYYQDSYQRYIYDSLSHSVDFAGHTLTLYDWYAVFENKSQVLINDMRWVVEYWDNQGVGQWRILDLWSPSYLAAIEGPTLLFGQNYTDNFSKLNVWYNVRNNDQVKVTLNFTAQDAAEYRFIWQLTGVDGEPLSLNKSVQFNDVHIGWGDAELNATYEWTAVSKKCDITFDNFSLAAGESYLLDPSVNPMLGGDSDDDTYYDLGSGFGHATGYTTVQAINNSGGPQYYYWQNRFQLNIPKDSTVTSANWSQYENYDPTARLCFLRRINEDDVGSLEGDSTRPEWANTTIMAYTTLGDGADEWRSINVTDLIQEQVNLAGWVANQYVGLIFGCNTDEAWFQKCNDYQGNATHNAYLNVSYTLPEDEYDYVDQISNEDGSSDIGTHSSFAAQQAGPDDTFDSMTEANTGGDGQNVHDFVDQLSNLHLATPDIGTHSVFADLQDYGANYDQMQESNEGVDGTDYNDWFTNYNTDIDSYADVGTESNPENAQDLGDSDYMTLQEANQGGGGGTTEYIAEAFTDSVARWNSEANAYDGNWGTATTYNGGAYSTADAYPSAYASGFDSGASGSGTITQVDIIVRMEISGLDASDQWGISLDVGASTGNYLQAMTTANQALTNLTFTDVTEPNGGGWSWAEIRSAEIHFDEEKVGGGDKGDWSIYELSFKVTTSGANDYELNFEYQWTSANYSETNERVCINVLAYQQTASETLKAWEWTGSAWFSLGTFSTNGWNNFTPTYLTGSTYYIMLNDTLQSDEGDQDSWSIDSIILHTWTVAVYDYEIDLEIGWTAADYDNAYEFLCIYPVTGGGWPSEDLKVDVWSGSWTNVFSDLTPDQWNNVSISSYLTGNAFEMRFLGGTEEGDSTQDTFEIDAVLLHTYNDVANYSLDLEEQWTDANYTRSNEQLCIYMNTTDAEDIKVQVWNSTGSSWHDLISDLTAGQWNNVSVSTWLTAAEFTIRFIDTDRTNDTNQDVWKKDCTLLHTWVGAQDLSVTVNELIGIFDSDTISADYHLSINELIGMSESVSVGLIYFIVVLEIISLAAFVSTTLIGGVSIFETIGLAAVTTTSVSLSTTINEIINLSDTVYPYMTGAYASYEVLPLSDISNTTLNAGVSVLESIPLADSISTVLSAVVNSFESIPFFDSQQTSISLVQTLYEVIDFFDSQQTSISLVQTSYEIIDLFETVTTNVSGEGEYFLTIYEVIDFSDSASTILDASVTCYATIGLFDSVTSAMSVYVGVFEILPFSDISTVGLTASFTVLETLPLSESISTILNAGVAVLESLPLSESISTTLDAGVLILESLPLAESISTTISLSESIFEIIPFFDSVTAEMNPALLLVIYEVIPIESVVVAVGGPDTTGIFYLLFLSREMWGYFGPAALVIGGYIVTKKKKELGVLWFIVICLVIGEYLKFVTASPQYWWHIYILLLGGLFAIVYPLWEDRF